MRGHLIYISDHIPIGVKRRNFTIFQRTILRAILKPFQKRRLIYKRPTAMIVILHLYDTTSHRYYNPLPKGQ